MWGSPYGKWLFAVSSSDRKINVFQIGADGLPKELSAYQSPVNVTTGHHITGLLAD